MTENLDSAVLSLRGKNLGKNSGPYGNKYPFRPLLIVAVVATKNSGPSAPAQANSGRFVMLKVHAKILHKITILSLQGQIVTGETEILRRVVQPLPETNTVILDLAQVSKIDAHGLGVMLELRQRTHANGIRFELMNVSAPVNRILEMTRLDSVFQINSGVEYFRAASRIRRMSRLPRVRRRSLAALKSCA